MKFMNFSCYSSRPSIGTSRLLVLTNGLTKSGWTKFGFDQIWLDQIWVRPNLVWPKMGWTKSGLDQIWPDQIWVGPNMADQMCLDQIWGVIRPIITITTNFLNPSLLFQVHEALRNFYDRLLLPKEMDAVFQCIRNCVKSIFRENFDSAFEHLGKVDGQV